MTSAGLKLKPAGQYFYGYNSRVDPSISNVFSAAAYRFGHSLIADTLQRRTFTGLDQIDLSDAFFQPSLLFGTAPNEGVDAFVSGIVSQRAEQVDSFIAEQVRDFLFRASNQPLGLDLAALNIQRGRDHGLPGYNAYRIFCRLPRLRSMNDLYLYMDQNVARRFAGVYGHVDDIDLWPAGVAEFHVPGGHVGPTFACLISEQFLRLRDGDRFWYESVNQRNSFNPVQIDEIRKSSLASVLCANGDTIVKMQRFALLMPRARTNPLLDCSSVHLAGINFDAWIDSARTTPNRIPYAYPRRQ